MGIARVVFWVVVVSNLACRAPPEPVAPPSSAVDAPPSPFAWTVSSSKGLAVLTQRPESDGACALECALERKRAWTQPVCLGRTTDFAFVSDDCATAVMILEYPLRAARTESTPVALVVKGALPVVTYTLEQVFEQVANSRGEGRRVRWLAGVVGEPGAVPHLDATGTAIEFATLEGHSRRVRLSNPEDFALWRAPSATAPTPNPAAPLESAGTDASGLYQFVDGEGSTQFVMGLSQVPARFRNKARPVGAQISAVKGTKMPERPAPPLAQLPVVEPPRAPPAPTKPPEDTGPYTCYTQRNVYGQVIGGRCTGKQRFSEPVPRF
jgi:hypothetical protein